MLKVNYYENKGKYGVQLINNETIIKDSQYDSLQDAFDLGFNAMENYYRFRFDSESKAALFKRAELEYLMSRDGREKYSREYSSILLDLSIQHTVSGFARRVEDITRQKSSLKMNTDEFLKGLELFVKNTSLL